MLIFILGILNVGTVLLLAEHSNSTFVFASYDEYSIKYSRSKTSSFQPLCDLIASTNISALYHEWACHDGEAESDPCLWRGVLCNYDVVDSIILQSSGVRGTIPSSIGNLVKLTYLDVSKNNLFGVIPSSLGLLTNMVVLSMSQNFLSSSLPSTLGNLGNLVYLYLNNNLLTSTIPTSFIMLSSNMQSMFAFANYFTSTIPSFFGLYSNLIGFSLRSNRFTSSVPTEFCESSILKYLQLNDNLLSSSIPSCFGKSKYLQYLNLADNLLTGSIPTSLLLSSSLEVLIFNNNELVGANPSFLCALPTLTLLYLRDNHFKCFAPCQTDGDWSSTSMGYRCQDSQDVALYGLQQSFGIIQALNRVVETSKVLLVFDDQPLRIISYPGAFQYSLYLDTIYTIVSTQCLLFYLCADLQCNTILDTYNVLNSSHLSFRVHRPYFYFYCPYCDLCPSWVIGFDITVYSNMESNWTIVTKAPYENSSDPSEPYALGLCQKPWSGVTCTNGAVTSLKLTSLGLSGSIPSSISLLTGLTSLDLSSNAIRGPIPTALVLLTNLNTLMLTNNRITGTIPEGLTSLQNLVYLDLEYNLLIGSVPTFLAEMNQLIILYADGNAFSGQVSSELCDSALTRNATVSLKYCPALACYQESCWGGASITRKYLDTSLRECSPTPLPTSAPPTNKPTLAPTTVFQISVRSSTLSPSAIAAIVCSIAGAALFFLAVFLFSRLMSEEVKARRNRELRLQELPVHRALLSHRKMNDMDLITLANEQIATVRDLDFDKRTAIDIVLQGLNSYPVPVDLIVFLLEESLPPLDVHDALTSTRSTRDLEDALDAFEEKNDSTGLTIRRRLSMHSWAMAVQHDSDNIAEAVEAILDKNRMHINALANASDGKGRSCRDIAQPRIKRAILKRLNLHERYELKSGPPLHKSVTSLVVQATDHGKDLDNHDECEDHPKRHSEVVLKFMKHRDEFLREVLTRKEGHFDNRFVLPLLESYDSESGHLDDTAFREDSMAKGYGEYPYCLVMEAAARNLKNVIDQQLIAANDWEQINLISRQLALCLEHFHEKGVIHGDLKRKHTYSTW